MHCFIRWLLCTTSLLLQLRPTMAEPSSQRSMIIGGSQAPVGRYPYAVYLIDAAYPDSPFCGGSLIAPDVVLTAGHCLSMTEGVQNFVVVVGRYNVTIIATGEEFANSYGIPHPDYNLYEGDDNDFGLIILPNRTKADVESVHLNTFDAIPTDLQTVTYLGWGVTSANSSDPPGSLVPLTVDALVVSNLICSTSQGVYLGMNQSYEGYITENMICTMVYDEQKDSCQRDSGGPEVIKGASSTGSDDILVGVISWGFGCATQIFPGVSARVSKAYGWIKDVVCQRSTAPPSEFQCPNVQKTDVVQNADSSGTVSPTSPPSMSSAPTLSNGTVNSYVPTSSNGSIIPSSPPVNFSNSISKATAESSASCGASPYYQTPLAAFLLIWFWL